MIVKSLASQSQLLNTGMYCSLYSLVVALESLFVIGVGVGVWVGVSSRQGFHSLGKFL